MKKFIFILLLATMAVTAGWYHFHRDSTLTVAVISPLRGSIQTVIRVTGDVVNDRTVKMAALVDGQIRSMPVRKGNLVKAGQVLTVLDQREADTRLQKSRAELALEKQSIDESQRQLKRQEKLSRTGGTTQQLLDDAQAKVNAAQARFKVANAILKIEAIQREKFTVKAPFAGVITEKTTEVGQWIEAGTPLFTLVAEQGREIEVNIDAGDSAAVRIGQTVSLASDAWPDHQWQEKILRIAPAITQGTDRALNTFAVRISLGSDAPELILGQQVDARIHTASRNNILKLPFAAMIEKEGAPMVAIIRHHRVTLLPVKTGLEDFTHIEITEGINGNEQIILSEGRELQQGEAVKTSEQP